MKCDKNGFADLLYKENSDYWSKVGECHKVSKQKGPPFISCLKEKCKNMDYSIIIDKSGSMSGKRWKDCKAAVKLLAPIVTKQDDNGITLYFFDGTFKTYNHVKTADEIIDKFSKNSPHGTTKLSSVLSDALRPDTIGKSETILIITDGIPDSRPKLEKTIRL